MSLTYVGLLAAFGAGLLSFLSPCVFPLVPGYLSYLAGMSVQEAQSQTIRRWRVSVHALWFVLGFVLTFALLGAAAAFAGLALRAYQQILALTAVSATLVQGVVFLLAYAFGLGLPFLLVGILVDRVSPLMRRIRRYTGPISLLGGVLLILMGMLLLTGRLHQLANVLFPFSFSP